MTYLTCLEGLEGRLKTVVGIKLVRRGEPTSVQVAPLIYSLFDSFDEEDSDNSHLKLIRWRTLHRLCIRWQDNEVAEDELIDFLERIPDVVAQDPKLNGRLHHTGHARITAGDGGFVTIGNTIYRSCDFLSEVLEVTDNG
jgi:hypothetical protein